MAYFRILFATSIGMGYFCGLTAHQWGQRTFKVKAQIHDLERQPGSKHYQNPHLRSRFAKYGLPQRDVTLRNRHFQISYDQRNRMPNWVLEHLNYDKMRVDEDEEFCQRNVMHLLDPRVPKEFQSDHIDFQTEMQRFPLADYSNYPKSPQSVADCHIRTNCVPQHLQFHTGVWRDLEIYCRYLCENYDDVYVFSGPLFEPTRPDQMHYQVSQTNRLGFPSHYYKIVIVRDGDCFSLACYLLENRFFGLHRELGAYRVQLAVIENKAGFKLFKDGVNVPETLLDVADFREHRLEYMPNEVLGEVAAPLGVLGGGGEQNGHNGHV